MLKFPYGNSDFYQVSTGGFFYIDRTDRIPWLEEVGQQLLFLRPRRFGKSLLLSMLENYGLDRTDLRQKDRADLTKLDAVQKKLIEATTQLQQYRATLTQKYGVSLRLRTYAVVVLGFDRLVWQEV